MGINARWDWKPWTKSFKHESRPSFAAIAVVFGVFHALLGYMLSLGKAILHTHSPIRYPAGLMGVAGNSTYNNLAELRVIRYIPPSAYHS